MAGEEGVAAADGAVATMAAATTTSEKPRASERLDRVTTLPFIGVDMLLSPYR